MPPEVETVTAGWLATLLARLDPALVRRVLRYGFAGVAVSVFYSLVVIACVSLFPSVRPTIASIIAFFITLPIGYLAHGKISFSDRPYDSFQPLRFAVSTVTSFTVAVGGMYFITEIGGYNYLFGIAWNWLVIPAMNFLTYMFWVFRTARSKDRTA